MKMTPNENTNTYEEARKQRLEENKKRFQDLGIAKISNSLAELTDSEKKSQQRHLSKPRSKITCIVEPRRSTRARNPILSYSDVVDIDLPSSRKRSRSTTASWGSYLARPLDEVKVASFEERNSALKAAEEFQRNLKSENPCFVKSMVRSHVYSCFWLGLPSKFCEDHLPKSVLDMELEDDDGKEYEAIYIGKRTGLSGGWRAFALDHKLDDGDALVFELIEPTRFKIYIVRASMQSGTNLVAEEDVTVAEKKSEVTKKLNSLKKSITSKNSTVRKNDRLASMRKLPLKGLKDEVEQIVDPTKRNGVPKRVKEEVSESEEAIETKEAASVKEREKRVSRKSKRKLAPKSSR